MDPVVDVSQMLEPMEDVRVRKRRGGVCVLRRAYAPPKLISLSLFKKWRNIPKNCGDYRGASSSPNQDESPRTTRRGSTIIKDLDDCQYKKEIPRNQLDENDYRLYLTNPTIAIFKVNF